MLINDELLSLTSVKTKHANSEFNSPFDSRTSHKTEFLKAIIDNFMSLDIF